MNRVEGFEVGWGHVCAVLVEAAVVEPVDPFGGGELDLVAASPRSSGLDQFGLEQPVDGLGQALS